MRRLIIEQGEADLTSHSGLALVGLTLNEYTYLTEVGRGAIAQRCGIPHADVLRSHGGQLCLGKGMNKQEILDLLHDRYDEIEQRFNVKRLRLFGSAARDELQPDSDIDILVGFKGPATFDGYMELMFYLEKLLGNKVDLVTEKGLRKELRPVVEKDAIRVA